MFSLIKNDCLQTLIRPSSATGLLMNCSLEHLALPSVLCSGLSECRSLPKSFSAPQSVPLWLHSLLCMPKENGSSYLMFQTVPPRKTPLCKLSGVSKTPTRTSLQISEETSLLDQLKNACGFILRIGSLIRGLKNLLTLFDVSHCLDLKKKTAEDWKTAFWRWFTWRYMCRSDPHQLTPTTPKANSEQPSEFSVGEIRHLWTMSLQAPV